ncbi:UNVERIFIED_CONTAM: High affinity cAMP-specific 3',5'-cyclic phosphodiesterase 7A [Siphonaria sp. JEL0065]|nr:High affinity cAMP-specific 3',5'-cyclic phosphodiesterase 7A [Siphonaria sp. JEL0065]
MKKNVYDEKINAPNSTSSIKQGKPKESKKSIKSITNDSSQKNLMIEPEKLKPAAADNIDLIKSHDNVKTFTVPPPEKPSSHNDASFGVGVAAAIANAEALHGLASPYTLEFYDPEMETGYTDYFAIYYIAMWRKALLIILAVGWAYASPFYITAYIVEAVSTSVKHQNGDATGFGIGLVLLVSSFLVILLGSYDFERNMRSQYIQTRSFVQANEKLVTQLTYINTNYNDKILELDTPLEKAIGLINVMRSDPKLNRHHMEALGILQALLNSNNLMSPDIETETGRLARDEEEEAFLFSNLYRGRPKAKNRLSTAVIDKPIRKSVIEDRKNRRFRAMSNASSMVSKTSNVSIASLYPSVKSSAKASFDGMPIADSVDTDESGQDDSVISSSNWRPSIFGRNKRESYSPDQPRKSKAFDNTAFIAMSDAKRPSLLGVQNSGSLTVSPILPRRRQSSISSQHRNHSLPYPTVNLTITTEDSTGQLPKILQIPLKSGESKRSHDITQERMKTSDQSLDNDSMSNLNTHLHMVSLLEKVDQWNWEIFDVHELSEHRPLFTLSHYLFLRNNLYNKFQIHVETFLNFATDIEAGYHAEPGRNNNFLVNTSDQLALLYNDRSILENHHVAAAFKILQQPECNFTNKLSKEEYKEFREMMIDLVLATDLQAQHFSILSMFKNKVSLTNSFDPVKVNEDRTLLFKMMIKCADVSNPTKAWPIYEKWTHRVLEEFFTQGDAEKALGIPVSPYYDRDTIYVPASQMGFIDFICIPLFEAFAMYADISVPVEGIISNRAYWLVQVQMKNAAEAEANAAKAAATAATTKENTIQNSETVTIAIHQPGSNEDQSGTVVESTEKRNKWKSIKALLKKDTMKDLKKLNSVSEPPPPPRLLDN